MNWTPPTVIERELYEAGLRGDVAAQLRVLAAEELYIGQYRHEVDAEPDMVTWRAVQDPATGWLCKPLLTRGMLPPWHPDWVFHGVSLDWVARFDWSGPQQFLVVNGGTPAAVSLPATPEHRAVWRRHYAENERTTRPRLLALHTGPLHGPLAFGLACGAHLAVRDGVPWNEAGTVYDDYPGQRRAMERDWGLTDHAGWQTQVSALLEYRNSPAAPEFALRVREQLRRGLGESPPADLWRETAAGTLHDEGAPPDVVADMEELVRRIMRYEARFRADGLLPGDGRVTTAAAYDYGRAACLARWGLAARLCDPYQAERTIVHAGALSKAAYRSWEDFSAGYVLGRALRFDDEEYGPYYEDALVSHRLLLADAGSPWRNIPW
ncbi:DUF1266 domain-containing protein [Streptomyces sp. LP05-1]|uniref:DUF1266 domain-containing protein n=1 Tax=Streptomyces pyxinae TaxID=2970734 RepID=A0ABT2CJM1_9ACTN|nr:DUF1266 domain-containing protein [Streptomyces sp. LP05-1]MCS0637608.1 DUF1266 domain-containing protein [Streptomyces sp. LP05-1]